MDRQNPCLRGIAIAKRREFVSVLHFPARDLDLDQKTFWDIMTRNGRRITCPETHGARHSFREVHVEKFVYVHGGPGV